MVIGSQDTGGTNNGAHPSGIPQDQIDNIMSGIANTGDVKMNNHRKKLRQRFDIIKKLGQGTYGKVQLGINKETGQEVAIKTIKKCKIEAEADLVRIRREVQIMSSVQHPNIIHIYEVFENREKMVLVMEFAAGGELYDYLSERKVLNEEEARRIFRQVATAVYYCHKHKICHRDLKLENILLDEQGNAKIADFGLSNVFDEKRLLATFCGSPLYASPEIVEGTPYHGPEVDCWSLGVLLYTLVYGSMPFDGSNFKRLVKQISQGDYYEPKKPSRASSLIREMLTVCPRKRATIEQICSHWWVNENDNMSCLELAEDLANQTPVRLDVLLSLTPVAITADQLVVPSADGASAGGKGAVIPRSHSVGSIREVVPNTEAERRILDMVAAGGEAALMPSPTRTITPAQSPIQTKRKLENTVSTDNATGVTLKKKDKPESGGEGDKISTTTTTTTTLDEETIPMEIEDSIVKDHTTSKIKTNSSRNFSAKEMQVVGDLCEQLIQDEPVNRANLKESITTDKETNESILKPLEDSPEKTKGATKVIKKFVNKHKTADLVNVIGKIEPEESNNTTDINNAPEIVATPAAAAAQTGFIRKCSLQDESPLNKFNTERRKSRILETAEKFQQMNANTGVEKPKKIDIPGISVGNFKKEFERKASTSTASSQPTASQRRALQQVATAATPQEDEVVNALNKNTDTSGISATEVNVEASDSKASVSSFSLEDARRSMENSIALLRQAQTESSKDVNQLCDKTANIRVSDTKTPGVMAERERKLKNARAIIGNAIQPVAGDSSINTPPGTMKTSTASITLKSATLPRRKTTKTEIQLDIKPPIDEQTAMRFTTEMQHPVADLRSAPPREGPVPYSPIKTPANPRASSLEPKEHIIPIHKPPSTYARTISNTTTRSGSLSRQSTNDSESDTTTTNMSQSTITGSSQPIKKSPREFIIPIAVEGGGFITPREGSIEPSDSTHTNTTTSSRSTFGRLRPTRRIGSLLSDSGVDDSSPFQKLRTSSSNRDGDEDAHFTLHKLRSSRPVKKLSQDNDSQSSGEEDDDDGFEILTAENLFSTLLQRVRALTNRMNVNNDITTGFPTSSRLLSNMRQAQSPFWNQEPFGRLNSAANSMSAPWRHSMSRDLGSDMDSMFSRTGATLPRGNKKSDITNKSNSTPGANDMGRETEEPLDLADLDLSRLRLSKKDLETLSNIAPGLPICFQEQLLAKLPPTQARKLSRTLSVQTNQNCSSIKVYKRSQSSGRNTFNGDYSDNKVIETKSENSSAVSSSSFKSENNEENVKDLSSIYNSDVNDKYKYYSPYVNKFSKDIGTYKNGPKPNVAENYASCSTMLGRPPSGRISPPLVEGAAANVPRRPTQRRISRLLRPDFCDQPLEEIPGDDKLTCISNDERKDQQTISTTSPMAETQSKLKSLRHVRNKSIELFSESSTALLPDSATCNRKCGVSGSSDLIDDTLEKHDLADKILQELQVLSSIRSQREQSLECSLKKTITEDLTKDLQGSHECSVKELSKEALSKDNDMLKEKLTSTIKKIKKVKTKEKSTESSTDADTKKTSVVKKVKKFVKNSEAVKTPIDENESSELLENLNKTDLYSPKKISKLKRPKSYPMKESISSSNTTDMCHTTLMASSKLTSINTNATTMEKCSEVCNSGVTDATARESRLLRPKSYPSSKLATPKEIKKPLRSKITTIDESTPSIICPTKSDNPNQAAKSESSTNQPNEPSSTFVPKPIKVTKKSKLSPPTTTISANASTSDTTSSTGEDSKEPSPAATVQLKEKIAAKKPNKGLLYAIGQKFEKLRASATSNSCANVPVNKKSSSDSSSPEKSNVKSSTAKKTKSLENATTKIGKASTNAASGEDTNKAENISSEVPSKPIKSDKRSRIDAMIRNLRERSVPRSQPSLPTESNYIKRAISVEEMPGTFNRKSVNKVLGLFKRYEKDCGPSTNRVRNTRSTSNIQRHLSDTSPLYQNTEAFLKLSEDLDKNKKSATTEKCKGGVDCKCDITTCPDCIQMTLAKQNLPLTETKIENKGNKEKRKGLKLELTKSDGGEHNSSATSSSNIRLSKKYNLPNDNEIYSNISPYSRSIHSSSGNGSISMQTTENVANNNNNTTVISNNNNNNITNNNNSSSLHNSQTSGYRTSSTHEINNQNNNMLSPSFENFGTYSSDSRSYQEDCASTSTFLSPTEEPELCFDTWSVCSEDNYRGQGATPSPTVSRLSSRLSQASSPTRRIGESSEPSESVVDRIKRRSFYCRFNEKKPKRTSSIVGPSAVRDYYREQNVASKSRSSNRVITGEREHSPDITQEFFRPLKLSPIGTELKPPVYRSPFNNTHDYSMATGKPRKSLNDIRTPTSPSCLYERRYGSFGTPENELTPSRYKLNSYDEVAKAPTSSSNTYYNTYNPKRRYSFNTNGSGGPSSTSASNNTSSSAHIEGYATLGRRPIRAYDHRTMSLLDAPSSSSYRNEGNSSIRDYTTNLSRSNSRYRKSSTSRSPTNI